MEPENTELNYEELNELIEQEKAEKEWLDKHDVTEVAQVFSDLSTTFHQDTYLNVIQWFNKMWKKQWYELQHLVIYKILTDWYNEISWENAEHLPEHEMTMSFEEHPDDRQYFISISRKLFKWFNKKLTNINLDPEWLGKKNVYNHIALCWCKQVVPLFNEVDIVNETLKDLSHFEIK